MAILAAWAFAAAVPASSLAQEASHEPAETQPASPLTTPSVSEAPAPSAAIYHWAVILPTYPLAAYRTQQVDPVYNWPYYRFDEERFLYDAPQSIYRFHRVIALENDHLRVLLLPDLGGRIWQVIHKPTGHTMFYQNTVVKPSPWGPANQLGWLALGGLEWNLPVVEHGYDWGTPWDVQTFIDGDGAAVAILSTPDDGRYLAASMQVKLPPDAAHIEIQPHIHNVSDHALHFDYWHNAMLAPGPDNHPSPDLRFILPTDQVTVHSSGDQRLPADLTVISWPTYNGLDLSRLGNWDQYAGFFEYPSGHGPFAGVYDPASDSGVVRVYPATIAPGSKIFALGWSDALTNAYYTDDDSSYVELHGGLAPTFFEQAYLDADASIAWQERWYPVNGIGQFTAASEIGAISVRYDRNDDQSDEVDIDIYPVEPFSGALVLQTVDGDEVYRQSLTMQTGEVNSIEVSVNLIRANTDNGLVPDEVNVYLVDSEGVHVLSQTVYVATDRQ